MDITMLKNALTTVVSSEFADVPEDDALINIQPSLKFQKKMAKLIKQEKRVVWHYTNTTYKRVIILVAVLLMMFTTACSVSAIREPIVKFFTEAYESFTRYFFEGDTIGTITNVYEIKEVPDGFELEQFDANDSTVYTVYVNGLNKKIILTQSITDGGDPTADIENGVVKEIQISGNSINLYTNAYVTQAYWVQDGYFMTLLYEGNITEDDIIKIIENIKIK